MNPSLEYNARFLPAGDVARTFIPPEPHFGKLISRGHTLLLGPRGSGKTTLLKMLTLRALSNWNHPQAPAIISQITFNAAFVAADATWGKQIDALNELDLHPTRKEASFVLHTIRALIVAMRDAVEFGRRPGSNHLGDLTVEMTTSQEEEFVIFASDGLRLKPRINSILGLELAAEGRLNSINLGHEDNDFRYESLLSSISLLIASFNGVTGQNDRRWALLFDELEIAPARIQSLLLSSMRSADQRLIVKLAIAPYLDDLSSELGPTSPHLLHDYQIIPLAYSYKEDAIGFSSSLIRSKFGQLGIDSEHLDDMFEPPLETRGFGRQPTGRRKRDTLPREFQSLAKKDDSFRRFAIDNNILQSDPKFNENWNAQFVRKILPIVVARDFYIRKYEEGSVDIVMARSRKAHSLYTGFPSIIEISEGNPRAILTLVGSIARRYAQSIGANKKPMKISAAIQSQAIISVELLLTSLLQVIPLDLDGFDRSKGLLEFIDQIGRAFEDRLLKGPFKSDYVSTFSLHKDSPPAVVAAVGKALNAGAIIHVPYPGSGHDILFKGIRGQKFRLSYGLSARYKLLLTLGDSRDLTGLMHKAIGIDIGNNQLTMFRNEKLDD